MKEYRHAIVLALMVGSLVLSSWGGPRPGAQAQGYGGGTGTSTLSFEPKTVTVESGKTASVKVTVTLSSGKTRGTNLRATEAPDGLAIRFDPASGNPTFTSAMTVKAASTAKPGAYTVKIQATGDDPSPVVQYTVTVAKASYGY